MVGMQEHWWANQLPSGPRSKTLSWHIPMSIPSINPWKGRNPWKSWSCRFKAARSPWHRSTTGYLTVRWWYWRNHRSQRPQTRLMTHCNKHLQVKLFGQKGVLCDTLWHTTASIARVVLFFYVVFISVLGFEHLELVCCLSFLSFVFHKFVLYIHCDGAQFGEPCELWRLYKKICVCRVWDEVQCSCVLSKDLFFQKTCVQFSGPTTV